MLACGLLILPFVPSINPVFPASSLLLAAMMLECAALAAPAPPSCFCMMLEKIVQKGRMNPGSMVGVIACVMAVDAPPG
jgi:hypothetical protein